ncbi:bifunctional phosphopantothenoylcysteine decarboxylase/phosphopantothenate--cysteine ligase CoaBC [Pasteurellaceae bacterium HPA106]|uniref:bifunctional phosphopantothenoylcysteine decarboxylase/phosphopantothenate--cysteine ligase CoaBC n=1 Tax=Spirabiliibacterium pneumoniae TaxID=221400 RepID=UPI001AADD6D7|nr:bifunctional phosphopantothenoylcysteine decarboxylase/phosphopantothenate--cysteine ligase CoaBC [Spirabiliibacterium pneumoniae]MBE2896887.1 bifunctional phosphopantothenoylcysteine decarboxylase/phosphopantothenate--cysteine ligase CoaBC [Spirabiliibacterium pneumoniae]
MNKLAGKNIVVGITAGIAAYKSIEFIRLLRKAQANVRVVLTNAAQAFVTPLTLQAISGNAVATSLLDPQAELAMGHIELAKWADMVVIAPATADVLARLACGQANDLLTTLCLATRASLLLAPAMNQQMFAHAAVQANLTQLKVRGAHTVGPNAGEQACGDVGLGRMAEPAEIVAALTALLVSDDTLSDWVVTLTAGPTQEAIDPVRYISNHSSGKMGFALAQAFAERGAQVNLIAGPVALPTPDKVTRIDVLSADEMYQHALELATQSAVFVGCAAVADYKMAQVAAHKLKKTAAQDTLTLTLVKNPDIIASVAALQTNRPFVVGFAAETQNVAEYAQSKLVRKKLDMICANDVSQKEIGFGREQNALSVFWPGGQADLPQADKLSIARQVVDLIIAQRNHIQSAV